MKLSAFLVTYNEEYFIEDCLSQLDQFVDHILIIDGDSTDNTLEIIKSYDKVEYIIYPHKFGFHDACWRNMQLLMARKNNSDWVLVTEPDERFEDKIYCDIHNLLNQDFCDVWHFRRIAFYDKKHIIINGDHSDIYIRLIRPSLFRVKKTFDKKPYPMYCNWFNMHTGAIRYFSWEQNVYIREYLSDVIIFDYGRLKDIERNNDRYTVSRDNIETAEFSLDLVNRFSPISTRTYINQCVIRGVLGGFKDDFKKFDGS